LVGKRSPPEISEVFRTANDITKLADHEHGQLYFELLPFCLGVCGAPGAGENQLTALDAFWLGLIDTVRAESTRRQPLVENLSSAQVSTMSHLSGNPTSLTMSALSNTF
jgi:hypothetical protein